MKRVNVRVSMLTAATEAGSSSRRGCSTCRRCIAWVKGVGTPKELRVCGVESSIASKMKACGT